MSSEVIFLMVIAIVFVSGVGLFLFITSIQKKYPRTIQPPKPRLSLPTDKRIYTVVLDSELRDEEWEMILGAGWSLVTCNTEQRKEYAGCYPEAPSYNKTYWHYVFQKY